MRFLFCNVGWMEHYNGQNAQDQIKAGGSFVTNERYGHEVCNFTEIRNSVYGFFRPPGKRIKIELLGAGLKDEQISGVTVIWTAKRPEGGTVVVGWYKDATIYRNRQKFKKIPALQKKNGIDGYRVKAEATNVRLLPIDERTFKIPRGKSGMGQANVWYADKSKGEKTINDIKKIMADNKVKAKRSKKLDPEKNARVEKVAIQTVVDYFERNGYEVDSVEKDNVGWDLQAESGKNKLRIEVKGLSGSRLIVDLTPNEYKAFSDKQLNSNYRLCVVHSALTKPALLICRYSIETGGWIVEDAKDAKVEIKTKQSASIEICI